jgi:hydroxyethylthiazole kinase
VSDYGAQAAVALARLRQQRPLIHHITNQVVMNDTANVTLHLGALPVMAHAIEEVAEMTGQAGALVLNLGTLTAQGVESMRLAGSRANERGIPVVLDPVGAGATGYRTQTTLALLEDLQIAVVRGNLGEIAALAGQQGMVRGVESIATEGDPQALAGELARRWSAVVAITGARDIVSDGQRMLGVDNGHPWLATVTGTGCMATTAISAFTAVEADRLVATAAALACFGLAAEAAAGGTPVGRRGRAGTLGPASFKARIVDLTMPGQE